MVLAAWRTDTKLAEVAESLAELAQAQKATERSLKAFIDNLGRGKMAEKAANRDRQPNRPLQTLLQTW
jgi:hypothetical protein